MKETAKINLQKLILKVLCGFVAVWLIFFGAACSDKNTPSQSGGFFSLDETEVAGNDVDEANKLLKLIKQRFKDNDDRLEQLQNALKGKDADKVRSISDEIITEINAGSDTGKEAINKLREAQQKNINEDYKEYLRLKIEALEKYVEAFEEYRQVAIFLRQKYDPKDVAQHKIFKDEFDKRQVKFKEIMEDARQASEQANKLAKESLNRKS